MNKLDRWRASVDESLRVLHDAIGSKAPDPVIETDEATHHRAPLRAKIEHELNERQASMTEYAPRSTLFWRCACEAFGQALHAASDTYCPRCRCSRAIAGKSPLIEDVSKTLGIPRHLLWLYEDLKPPKQTDKNAWWEDERWELASLRAVLAERIFLIAFERLLDPDEWEKQDEPIAAHHPLVATLIETAEMAADQLSDNPCPTDGGDADEYRVYTDLLRAIAAVKATDPDICG